MTDFTISQHAIDRFLERTRNIGQGIPSDPEATLRKLIKKAEPEKMHPIHKVRRRITHGKSAIYMKAHGWRFVFTEDGQTLQTVERLNPYQN